MSLRSLLSFALVFLVLGMIGAGAQTCAPLEMNITNNGPSTSSGEPQIAINPTNPNNLFIDYATFPVPAPTIGPAPEHACGGYVSMDRGKSWQPSFLPFPTQSEVTYSQCADGIAAFGPDGTLYAGGDAATKILIVGFPPNCPPGSVPNGPVCVRVQGNDPFARSTDGGLTWTPLPHPMGSPEWCPACVFAPGSGQPFDVFDRPWVAVDQSTGIVYFSARNILGLQERFVTASMDKGDTFEPIYAIDSPTYPQGGSDSNIGVVGGVLAVAYNAAPAPGGCSATCLIFETSTDFGATWDRHIVPLVGAANPPRPFLAANPLGKGKKFALMVFDSTGTQSQIYTTRDAGETWQGPTLVSESPANPHFKPWLSYGPLGQLVLVWRTWHGTPNSPTTPYDVWAAVGLDGHNGAVFSAPRRVSSVAAPYGTGGGGDDFSFITSDHQFVHAAWGDSRSGATQVWYSRISLFDFFRSGLPEHDD